MPRASSTGVRGLYRDADGRYRIDLRWRCPRTGAPMRHKERLPKTVTAIAAKARARAILDGALAGTFEPDRQEPPAPATLGPALDAYLDAHSALRSIASRRTHAKAWRAFLGDEKPLDAIAPFDVERFRAARRKDETSPATVNRHVATLKHFAGWASSSVGLMGKGAAAELRELRMLREPEGRVRYCSADEEKTIDASLDGWLRPIALACKYTGARLGEMTGLRRREIDRRAGVLVLARTKTGRTRQVVIVPALETILDALPDLGPDSYAFPIPRRQGRTSAPKRTEDARRRDVASKAWASFCAAHDIVDLHAHDLRHHAATMIRRAGGGLDTVAKVLGHTNVRTAARYAHVEVEDTRRFLVAASQPVAPSLPPGERAADAKTEGAERIRTAV